MCLVLVVPRCLYLCNQRDAFWVLMCPAVHTQWNTPLKHLAGSKYEDIPFLTVTRIAKYSDAKTLFSNHDTLNQCWFTVGPLS